jgi:hypothetical protein
MSETLCLGVFVVKRSVASKSKGQRLSGTGLNRSVRSAQSLEGTKKAYGVGGSKSGPDTLLMAAALPGTKIPPGTKKRIPAGDGDPFSL